MRDFCAGISLNPKLEGFFGLFQIPSDHLMEARRNEVFLGLARSVTQFVSLAGTLNVHTEFTNTNIRDAQPYVGECELWVECDGLLIIRNSRGVSYSSMNLNGQAE